MRWKLFPLLSIGQFNGKEPQMKDSKVAKKNQHKATPSVMCRKWTNLGAWINNLVKIGTKFHHEFCWFYRNVHSQRCTLQNRLVYCILNRLTFAIKDWHLYCKISATSCFYIFQWWFEPAFTCWYISTAVGLTHLGDKNMFENDNYGSCLQISVCL